MANRQPFELKRVLIVYNFGMVLLSVYMFKEVIKLVHKIDDAQVEASQYYIGIPFNFL